VFGWVVLGGRRGCSPESAELADKIDVRLLDLLGPEGWTSAEFPARRPRRCGVPPQATTLILDAALTPKTLPRAPPELRADAATAPAPPGIAGVASRGDRRGSFPPTPLGSRAAESPSSRAVISTADRRPTAAANPALARRGRANEPLHPGPHLAANDAEDGIQIPAGGLALAAAPSWVLPRAAKRAGRRSIPEFLAGDQKVRRSPARRPTLTLWTEETERRKLADRPNPGSLSSRGRGTQALWSPWRRFALPLDARTPNAGDGRRSRRPP